MVVIEDIIISASTKLKATIDHELYIGTEAMVAKKLMDRTPETRYPLIAIVTGFDEVTDGNGYVSFSIARMIFGTLTTTTDTPVKRISDTGTFKTILYPLYENFLRIFCQQPGMIYRDWQLVQTTKNNIYGEVPATDKVADVLDAIEIKGFKNKIQISSCQQ